MPPHDAHWLARAIELALQGDGRYGAVIVDPTQDEARGGLIAEAFNTVARDNDPSAHAEVNAIRRACRARGNSLVGFTLYTSAEPCPMCSGAIAWAGLSRVVYGASIDDLVALGQGQITLPSRAVFEAAPEPIAVTAGVLREEAMALFRR